jgi:outer membrane protein OmpA-like peptidoglycan-associated protein
MSVNIRNLSAALLGVTVMTACVTKSTFRREMNDRRTELNSEVSARTAADSALSAEIAAQIAALRTDLNGLRTEFGTRITAMEEGIKFAFPVNFAFDDATVREQDQVALDRFAQIAQKYYNGAVVTVEGFADPAGSTRYNMDLSRRRAEAVRAYPVSKGMTDAQLKAIGYGESRQVVAGAERDDTGAELNRRVVFVVETKGDSTATNMTASALR